MVCLIDVFRETSDIVDELSSKKVNFTEWSIDGIDIWPIVQMNLREAIFQKHLTKNIISTETNNHSVSYRSQKIVYKRSLNNYLKIWQKHFKAILADYCMNDKVNKLADFLFIRLGSTSARVLGKNFCKLTGPLIHGLQAFNKSTLTLEVLDTFPTDRFHKSVYFQAYLDFATIKSKILSRLSPKDYEVNLAKYDDFLRILSCHSIPSQLFEIEEICKQVSTLQSYGQEFSKIIKNTQAKFAFTTDRENLISHGLAYACWQNGVRLFEILHYGYDESQIIYNYGKKDNPYNTMPNGVLCWTEPSMISTKKFLDGINVDVVNVGNPFIHWVKKHYSILGDLHAEAFVKKMNDVKNSSINTNKAIVLLTLSWFEQDEVVRGLSLREVQIIEKIIDEFTILVRLHPVTLGQKSNSDNNMSNHEVVSYLQKYFIDKIDNIVFDGVSSLPLPFILDYVDVHITMNSSATVESGEMGVPSIFTDPSGFVMFHQLIANGTCKFYEPGTSLPLLIFEMKKYPKKSANFDESLLESFVNMLSK